jgi:release factor glutamine methyltransferase
MLCRVRAFRPVRACVTPLEAVHEALTALESAGVDEARLEAERLVAHALGLGPNDRCTGVAVLDAAAIARLRSLVERRRAREPLAYILGEWPFRRLVLKVDRRALIPRAETEVVVERCLERIRDRPRPRVIDIGTGSGAIALAIADEHRVARVVAVDSSAHALALARENVERTGLRASVDLVHGSRFAGAAGGFALVVSNPPYIAAADFTGLPAELRLYEPYEAIVGSGVMEAIVREAKIHLDPAGWIVLECGRGDAQRFAAELRAHGYRNIKTTADRRGDERVVEGERP